MMHGSVSLSCKTRLVQGMFAQIELAAAGRRQSEGAPWQGIFQSGVSLILSSCRGNNVTILHKTRVLCSLMAAIIDVGEWTSVKEPCSIGCE